MTKNLVLSGQLSPEPNIIFPKGDETTLSDISKEIQKMKDTDTIPQNSTYKVTLEIKGER